MDLFDNTKIEVAIGNMVRKLRVTNQMTQKEMQEKLGMKNIFSYQRLENGVDMKLSTLVKIKAVFEDFEVDPIINKYIKGGKV